MSHSDISEDDWAAAMAEQAVAETAEAEPVQGVVARDAGRYVDFSVRCGDWVYPSRDSTGPVQYPVDYPLVLVLFSTFKGKHKVNLRRGDIDSHLSNCRRLHLTLDADTNTLSFKKLTNDQEPDFEMSVAQFSPIKFDPETLARGEQLYLGRGQYERNDAQRLSVLVTSILLQHFLAAMEDTAWDLAGYNEQFMNDLYFRKATVPEIESIGRW